MYTFDDNNNIDNDETEAGLFNDERATIRRIVILAFVGIHLFDIVRR